MDHRDDHHKQGPLRVQQKREKHFSIGCSRETGITRKDLTKIMHIFTINE